MLRTLQTQALSQKIATLFDTLGLATNMRAQPIPLEASPSYSRSANFAYLCEQPPRRRRTRRHRIVSAAGAMRTTWY